MSARDAIIASVLAATALLVLPQCAAPPPDPTTSSTTPAPAAPVPPAVHPVTAAELGPSWRPGCPVAPESLRRVEVDYVGFDGRIQRGEVIVHEELVAEVSSIFDELRRLRFPIEKMRAVAEYPGAEDELSMRDNNTSAFNCRGIPGTGRWSLHAYGRAVDINPLLNPYVDRRVFQPANAAPYLDRGRVFPGMLNRGDAAVRAFTSRGWRWGGDWRGLVDYQHFERR